MQEKERDTATERVGQFTMEVATADDTTQAAERWAIRGEVLAAWLLATWEQQQKAEAA